MARRRLPRPTEPRICANGVACLVTSDFQPIEEFLNRRAHPTAHCRTCREAGVANGGRKKPVEDTTPREDIDMVSNRIWLREVIDESRRITEKYGRVMI
jgi:hypothetical protein